MIPPFLRRGDVVGICATARWLTDDQIEYAVRVIEGWGFRADVDPHVLKRHFQLAGEDLVRREALQRMLDRTDIGAILVARGGYGTVRIIDELDWSGFLRNPKWVCGYSDITVLHAELARMNVASVHCSMPVSFADCTPEALANLRAALTGELREFSWKSSTNGAIRARGKLWGGNLSVLCSLLGSVTLHHEAGRLLFIEDVDEMHYHVDRMLTALTRAGYLSGVGAVIAGGFTQMRDNTREFGFKADNPWGRSPAELLVSHFGESPGLVSDMPAGHLNDNRAFYLGIDAILEVSGGQASLSFSI
jgi:muramoyltetrapeptide carboxypeptidase